MVESELECGRMLELGSACAAVRDALLCLSPLERELVLLIYFRRQTVEAAALWLGLSPAEAERSLDEARGMLTRLPEIWIGSGFDAGR